MELALAALMVVISADAFRRARRTGSWSWVKFAWVILAALLLAGVGVIIAVSFGSYGRNNPGVVTLLVTVVLLAGVLGITVVARGRSRRS